MTDVDDGNDVNLPKLDCYLAGECSASEAASVREWLAVDATKHEALLNEVRRVRDVAKQRPPTRGVGDAWRRAVQELHLDSSVATGAVDAAATVPAVADTLSSTHSTRRRIWGYSQGVRRKTARMLWTSVAGLAMGAAVVAAWYARQLHVQGHAKASVSTTYATGNGQRANIRLADGSTVSLNVASRLDVPIDYGKDNRTLRLSGEALFNVAHRAGAPFTVVAGAATARVMGTSFIVRHYPTDSAAIVAVRDGKVSVHSVVLTATEQAEFGLPGTVRIQPARAEQFTFATGTFALPGMTLRAAIPELDRWYDVDLRLGDASLGALRIKGKFAAGSLVDLAAILRLTFDVRVVRDGRVLTLYPG